MLFTAFMGVGKPLTVYGEGTQTRSFQYVTDLVNGMIMTMEGDHVGPFNIGNPGEFTMIELVRGSAVDRRGRQTCLGLTLWLMTFQQSPLLSSHHLYLLLPSSAG